MMNFGQFNVPSLRGAVSALTRVFDALWRRSNPDFGGPAGLLRFARNDGRGTKLKLITLQVSNQDCTRISSDPIPPHGGADAPGASREALSANPSCRESPLSHFFRGSFTGGS